VNVALMKNGYDLPLPVKKGPKGRNHRYDDNDNENHLSKYIPEVCRKRRFVQAMIPLMVPISGIVEVEEAWHEHSNHKARS
jgi:hypothetical protein